MNNLKIDQVLYSEVIPSVIEHVTMLEGESYIQYLQKLDEWIEHLAERRFPEYVFRSETSLVDEEEEPSKPTTVKNNIAVETNLTPKFKFRISYGLRTGVVTLEKEYIPSDKPPVQLEPFEK